MRAEKSWSLLDPKPVLVYLEHHEEYIVYWNGIVMPHSYALAMAVEQFGIFATPEMKNARLTTYKKLYYANAFETRAWDNKVMDHDVYSYLKNLMTYHITKTCEGKTPQEILSWFDYKRARTENYQQKEEK